MDVAAPKSFSNIGRTADAASKHSAKAHVHKKMLLQPWDGLDLVEQILSEANGKASHNAREQLHLSSPRVNPVLEDKAVFEGSTHAMTSFLNSTAKTISNLPAATTDVDKRAQPDVDEDDNFSFSSSFKGKGRLPKRANRPSPSFLSGPRPDPATISHAPAVGKYLPKHKVVERRAPTPVISRITRKKGPRNHNRQTAQSQLADSIRPSSEVLLQSGTLDGRGASSPHGSQSPAHTSVTTVYRKHNVRDVSSAFRSNTPRGEITHSVDLSYWPLPLTGATTYAAGAFHGNARERAYTPFGTPQGTKADYNVKELSRPSSSLNFSFMVNRENHKTRLTYPTEDTTNLDYRPDDLNKSDRHRFRAHYSMSQQTLHPKPSSPAPGDGLGPYSGSMVSSTKRGFVDIRRMVGRATAFAMDDDADRPPEILHPEYSQVGRSSPAVTVPRTGRDSPGPGRSSPNLHDISYDVHDGSIRRHRPMCVIPRGTRSTFVVKPTCQRQEPYEPQDPLHVSVIDFTKQLSRDSRDKRFEFK